MSDLVDGLELDRGELAEGALTPPAVVGPFDPDHDRQAQLLSGGPSSAVEHVPTHLHWSEPSSPLGRHRVGRGPPRPNMALIRITNVATMRAANTAKVATKSHSAMTGD